MNLTKTSGTLGLMALSVIASPFAIADDTGWYGGLSVGQSRAKIDDVRITSGLLGQGFATTSIDHDDRNTGYKLFGGYQFNRNFAFEGGYFDLGKLFSYTATTVPAGTLTGNIKLRGVNFDAVGILPLTEKFSAFGRAGLNYAQARDSFTGTGAVVVSNPNPSKSELNYKFGVGLQYALTESLGLRLEAERYRINDAINNKGDVDLISLGLVFRFGGKTPAPAPVQRAAAPEPVAPAPVAAPAPQPKAVTPPPVPIKVTFSADSLFDFDKAVLKPAGKQQLDKLASNLRGASFDLIKVTGYTDRIGSHKYNMKLSTRRAAAVKSYLMESAGIPTGKIVARGADGSDPVTKPGVCKGKTATKKLIACLQPDRRVEVTVSGSR